MNASGQDTTKEYNGIMLSPVLIADMENGFDVDKFINHIQKDSTFYKAFKSLSLISLTQYNDIAFYDKKGNKEAYYNSISLQKKQGDCRKIRILNQKHSPNYFDKNGDPNFVTAEFYHKLFFVYRYAM